MNSGCGERIQIKYRIAVGNRRLGSAVVALFESPDVAGDVVVVGRPYAPEAGDTAPGVAVAARRVDRVVLCFEDNVDVRRASKCCRKLYLVSFSFVFMFKINFFEIFLS